MKPLLPTLMFSILLCGCRSPKAAEHSNAPAIRVLTYNVNYGEPRADLAVEILRNSKADIVCLQETTPAWEQLIRSGLKFDYSFIRFCHSSNRMGGGMAFLSKLPAREVAFIPSKTTWFDGWIMRFESNLGPVQVLNVHLRPPVSDSGSWVSGYLTTDDDRLAEIKRFYQERDPRLPLLVAGDFNDGEHSSVLKWLGKQGMTNALPQFDYGSATWEWRTSIGTVSRRMDHIVHSAELRCTEARVLRAGASDHFPVEAVFATAGSN